jgi:DHA1 family inner membrane transport protein
MRPHPSLGLLALAVGGFAIGTTEFATMGVLPQISSGLHVSIPRAGHLISLYALGVVIGAPLFAVLGARLPRKGLLIALMSMFALGNLASAIAPSYRTLSIARFASGLPHGAYFGIGSLVAAALAGPQRRGQAVAIMLGGLTVANVVGVPLTTLLGQHFGWRSTYVVVTCIAGLTIAAIALCVPQTPVDLGAAMRRELAALRRSQVWLVLLVGSVGFGGFFAVYSYIAPTMTQVAGYPSAGVAFLIALMGVGMTVGNFAGGRLADRSVSRTMILGLAAVTVILALYAPAARHEITAALAVFLVGVTTSTVVPSLQARLMDVSGEAQSLAAALNHSALNIGNSLGAWLGGIVIAAGYGYASTAWVGAVLAAAGLAICVVSVRVERGTIRA